MNKIEKIWRYLMLALVTVLVASCAARDDEQALSDAANRDVVYLNLRLGVAVNNSGRANPEGGENGDGREDGIRHENEVKYLSLYIYNDPANRGVNAPATTPIKKVIHLTDDDFNRTEGDTELIDVVYSRTIEIEGYVPVEGDHVLVVANMVTSKPAAEFTTLGSLRDYLVSMSWQQGNSLMDAHHFIMSTAFAGSDEGRIITVQGVTQLGSKEKPMIATAHIERLAARIDFWFNNQNVSGEEMAYDVLYDADGVAGAEHRGETVGKVYFTHVVPVNVKQQPSYMIKRVTSGLDFTQLLYCGDETVDSNRRSSNYVIEPNTADKDATTQSLLDGWYGSTAMRFLEAHKPTDTSAEGSFFNAQNNIGKFLNMTGNMQSYTEAGYNFNKYVTLSYANENTQPMDDVSKEVVTALAFRGVFVPKVVYASYSPTQDILSQGAAYVRGTTFFRYQPTRQTVAEGDCLYFSNLATAEAYSAAHPEHYAKIQRYNNGVCFYIAWLRHSYDDTLNGGSFTPSDPHECSPMEYGIVRNNIYRLGISNVATVGSPTTENVDPEAIRMRIFVRKWNLKVHSQIIY